MSRGWTARIYPVALVVLVAAMVLAGAMAISLLVTGSPAYPVEVFGRAAARDGVIEVAAIRPRESDVVPQGNLQRLQLLPLPAPVARWTPPSPAELYAALARTGLPARPLLLERASVLATFGEHAAATRLLRGALAAHPRDVELHMLAAHNAWWAEQPLAADSIVGQALAIDPANADALRLRETIRRSTQPPLAVARAWAASGGAREQLLLARALVGAEQYGAALAPYRAALTDPAIRTDSLLLEAASAAAAADSVAALAAFSERYLAAHPYDTEIVLRLARAYAWRGDYDTALGYYARVPRRDAEFRFEVAQALVWSRREREAERMLEEIVATSPGRADAWKLLGDLAAWRGNWDQAVTRYAEARRADPAMPGLAAAIASAETSREQARLARLPVVADAYGAEVDAFADNQGFRWATTRASRSLRAGDALLEVVAQHNVFESGPAGLRSRNPGLSGRIDGILELGGRYRLDATLGAETYAAIRSFPLLALGVTAYDVFDMRVTADVRHQPAAFRVASLAALQARATSTVLGLSASRADAHWSIWTRVEAERIATIVGDARRASLAATVQRTLSPRLTATAGVSGLAYDRAAPTLPGFGAVFWSPRYYVEPTVGLTWRTPIARGVTVGAGANGGYGFVGEQGGNRRFDGGAVPTGGLAADVAVQRGRWDVGVEASTGGAIGRGYRAGSVRVRASYRIGG